MTEPPLNLAQDGPPGYAAQFNLRVLRVRSAGPRMRQTPLADKAGRFSILTRIDDGQVPIPWLVRHYQAVR
jgi:hypothetical protein